MIVISDTTIISTLYLIDKLYWLNELFPKVYIPPAVYHELLELEAADFDLQSFHQAKWIEVKSVKDQVLVRKLEGFLDRGESEAIALALECKAHFLLIDERKGSKKAHELGIPTLGLLRIILELKSRELIPLVKPVLDDIQEKGGFWLSKNLYKHVLTAAGEL